MKLVPDANIVISALIRPEGKTRDVLFSESVQLHAPQSILEELEEHRAELIEKSSLLAISFDISLSQIFSNVSFVPFAHFEPFIR